jgi:hypothetical protein
MFWFDDEVGKSPGDGVDDHASQRSASAVGAGHFGPDDELRVTSHDSFL